MKGVRLFRTIQVKLIVIYVLMILFAMQLIGVYFMRTTEQSFIANFSDSLSKQAILLAEYVQPYMSAAQQDSKAADPNVKNSAADLSEFVGNWFKVINADIQIVDANGIVLSTSQQNAQDIVGQKNTQTMVTRALQNIEVRDNEAVIVDTDGKRKKVLALPVGRGGKVIGAVYVVGSMEEIYSTIDSIKRIFFAGTFIALAMTAVLGVMLSNTITTPIKEITKQITSVAEGDFDRRVKIWSHDEIGQLGNMFNFMTDRLKDALSLNEEEKEKLASILSNMSDGVVATDEVGRVIVINHRASQMLQVSPEQAMGRRLSEIVIVPEQGARNAQDDSANTAMLMVREGEEEADERKIRVSFTPIHSREKGDVGTIAVLQDVTEQEEIEQARREFVANVSHELRTPLTTIRSYLEALEEGAIEEKPLAYRFLGVTRNETERMIRIVNDLLHLSRLDSRQMTLQKQWTSVAELLEEASDRFSFHARQRNIELTFDTEPGISDALLDRDKIDQVLDNLLSNAIKYTADGGRIELTARRTDKDGIAICVSDNGVGIPKKDIERIFERFYRVDKARSRNMGGTGLGLSIAREIVKAHGGTIMLESEYNQGTKVTFTLPDAPGESEAV